MASGSSEPGRDRNPNLTPIAPGPGGPVDRTTLDEARRRADRTSGIALLLLGIGITIMHMLSCTENALAAQFAATFQSYGIEPYRRPAGLSAISLAGLIGHPLIYAATLYAAILRWKRGKRALWLILLGSIAAMAFTMGLAAIGTTMHPELVEVIEQGGMPSPTP